MSSKESDCSIILVVPPSIRPSVQWPLLFSFLISRFSLCNLIYPLNHLLIKANLYKWNIYVIISFMHTLHLWINAIVRRECRVCIYPGTTVFTSSQVFLMQPDKIILSHRGSTQSPSSQQSNVVTHQIILLSTPEYKASLSRKPNKRGIGRLLYCL